MAIYRRRPPLPPRPSRYCRPRASIEMAAPHDAAQHLCFYFGFRPARRMAAILHRFSDCESQRLFGFCEYISACRVIDALLCVKRIIISSFRCCVGAHFGHAAERSLRHFHMMHTFFPFQPMQQFQRCFMMILSRFLGSDDGKIAPRDIFEISRDDDAAADFSMSL